MFFNLGLCANVTMCLTGINGKVCIFCIDYHTRVINHHLPWSADLSSVPSNATDIVIAHHGGLSLIPSFITLLFYVIKLFIIH